MTEVTLFGNIVTCEFIVVILITITLAMRVEIYWMLIGINRHYFCFADERTKALKDKSNLSKIKSYPGMSDSRDWVSS